MEDSKSGSLEESVLVSVLTSAAPWSLALREPCLSCPFPWIHAPCLPSRVVHCEWFMLVSLEETAAGIAGDVEGGGRKEICDCSEGSRGAGQSRWAFWSCVLISINATKPSVHAEYSGQGAMLVTAHSAGVTWNGQWLME